MTARRLIAALVAGSLSLVAACKGGTDPGSKDPANITKLSGDAQTLYVNSTSALPVVVRVTDAGGGAVEHATVNFAVTAGPGTVSPASATTDANGRAQATVTAGNTAGTVTIGASVAGTSLATSFTVTVRASALTCASPSLMPVGEVEPTVAATTICAQGGTGGAEYVIVAFNSSTSTTAGAQTVNVTGTNLVPVTGAVTNTLPQGNGGTLDIAASATLTLAERFDLGLRERERRSLAGARMDHARQAMYERRTGGASFTLLPPNVGDLMQLNTRSDQACTNPTLRTARVVAITDRAVVVADTNNPAGGFTAAEYESIGRTFDTLVAPLNQDAFGTHTDIDANQRVLLYYTRAVNELTPSGSGGVIGGFFFARDLFPKTHSDPNVACAGSNFAEMFYLLVPDPTGTINGNIRTKADVQQSTIATVGHELQHLINASRRIYINNATSYEVVWLNEAISHIAEELLFYRRSGMSPGQNISAPDLLASSARVAAYNEYQSQNFGRYRTWLQAPQASGPFRDDDELSTRGAAWALLRYLADRQSLVNQNTTWRALVNSRDAGLTNLAAVFGGSVVSQARDWSISVLTDDMTNPPLSAQYREPSWHFRSMYTQIAGSYPLAVSTFTTATSTSIVPSGSAYLHFRVAAGQQGSVSWSAPGGGSLPGTMSLSVVRVR